MPTAGLLAIAEARYLDARDLVDQLELGQARGLVPADLAARAAAAVDAAAAALTRIADEPAGAVDRRALAVMRTWLPEGRSAVGAVGQVGTVEDATPDADGLEARSEQIMARYSAEQAAVSVRGETMTQLAVLGRLAVEPSAGIRRELFGALEPVWRTIDGAGDTASPYRQLVRRSAQRWAAGHSPIATNARALGLDPGSIEPILVGILEAWRSATEKAPGSIEPWDWWYRVGAADRALEPVIPLARIRPLSDAYHAALGADPAELGIGFDVEPRPDRPPVPVAYTTFGRRPRLRPGGGWSPAEPWVLGTHTRGGLGELTELVHETGHGIHIAAIRARPAFADWPDSDAFTEALAELTALDTAEPAWQQHWLGMSVPEGEALCGRYADVVLDVCWALFEIRLHADPKRRPNDVWTELTSTYLGIAPHPQWSWWAIRGQLVQEPGYMVNYAIGPILAADLRARIRDARGDWVTGDPGWYRWVSERIYRWGLGRSSGAVLGDVLGRPPSADALLAEIARAAG